MTKRPADAGDSGADAAGAGSQTGKGAPDAGPSTRSVHGGERDHQSTDAITTPIYQTSTFWFPDSKTLAAYQEGRSKREE
jgi:hypothetical protein